MKHMFIHVNNPWRNTANTEWLEKEYRIVGTMPFLINNNTNTKKESISHRNSITSYQSNDINSVLRNIKDKLWLVEFSSGRVNVGYVPIKKMKKESYTSETRGHYHEHIKENYNNYRHYYAYENEIEEEIDVLNEDTIHLNDFVIIEADRGKDCGRVISTVIKHDYIEILDRIDRNHINKELHPKKIFRIARIQDRNILEINKMKEIDALEECKKQVFRSSLSMVIVKSEYQWDLRKLTFFFESDLKIDFRELVKDLYKEYKVRIWMCAVGKSKNHYLKQLIK